MTKRNKLFAKAINNPKNFKFRDLEALLNQFGFKRLKSNAGSHFKWRNEQKLLTFMAPRNNPVKTIYVKNLTRLLKVYFKDSL